jgi:hypothetical protein
MINHIIKAMTILTILFLPNITMAQDCAANDSSCAIAKKQVESLKSTGIKPLSAIKTSSEPMADSTKAKPKTSSVVTVQPFEIPTPGDIEAKNDKIHSSNDTQQKEDDINATHEKNDATTVTQQTTGMQYR